MFGKSYYTTQLQESGVKTFTVSLMWFRAFANSFALYFIRQCAFAPSCKVARQNEAKINQAIIGFEALLKLWPLGHLQSPLLWIATLWQSKCLSV